MNNYIAILVLGIVIIISGLIKNKKLFLIINLTAVGLLIIYYVIMIYVEYFYTFEFVNNLTIESLFADAQAKFNNLIYHLIAVIAFFVFNTALIIVKLKSALKTNKPAV